VLRVADESGEGFELYETFRRLGGGGEYLSLFAEDQDVGYRDERTWPFLVLDVNMHASESGGKAHPL
jgi:hypothetical protein